MQFHSCVKYRGSPEFKIISKYSKFALRRRRGVASVANFSALKRMGAPQNPGRCNKKKEKVQPDLVVLLHLARLHACFLMYVRETSHIDFQQVFLPDTPQNGFIEGALGPSEALRCSLQIHLWAGKTFAICICPFRNLHWSIVVLAFLLLQVPSPFAFGCKSCPQ